MHSSSCIQRPTPHHAPSSWYLSLIKVAHLAPSHPLFRLSLVRVEAVGKLLAVLVGRVVREHLLARCALEGLEAGFALDGLGRGVLTCPVLVRVRAWEYREDVRI
jgi:hypothetical protein